ncbi:ATP-binding protein [bacterium]|nr:ATP-binding protein [bacterium]
MKVFSIYNYSDFSKVLFCKTMPGTYVKFIFILLFIAQSTVAQSDKFAAARLYTQKGSDTTMVLLNEMKPSIDFEKVNDEALEYLLIKCNYDIMTGHVKVAWQVLQEAEMHYEASTAQSLKLRYELNVIYRDITKLQRAKELEPLARAFLHKTMNSNFPEHQIDANILMFRVFRKRSVKDSMNHYLKEANAIALDNDLKQKQALILRIKALMYLQVYEDHNSAVEYFDRSIAMYNKLGFELLVAKSLVEKAALYREQGLYGEAIKLYQQANITFKNQDADVLEGFVHRAMGRIYQDIDNHEEAIKRFNLLKNLLLDSSLSFISARVDTFLGDSYLALGNMKKAENLFLSSITLKEKISDRYTLPYSYNRLGNLYLKEQKFEQAKSQFENAIELSGILKIKKEIAKSHLGLSQLYLEQHKLNMAKKNALLALKYTKNKNIVETKFAALIVLAQVATKNKNYASANEYYQESVSLQDSVMSFGKAIKVTNIITGFEHEKREFDMLSLKSENQAKANEIRRNELRSKLYLLGFISIIVSFLLFLRSFIQNRKATKKQKLLNDSLNESNRKLSESNLQLEHFAQTASHDLKSPLTAINLFSSLLDTTKEDKFGEKEKRYIQLIAKSGKNLVRIIDDMLDFSKVGTKQLNLERSSLDLIVKDAMSSLFGFALDHDVTLKQLKSFPDAAMVDKVKLERVFQNIIANAIKFKDVNKKNSYVHIDYQEIDGFHQFSIIDNGIGIPKTNIDIFKLFTHLNTNAKYTGTGIGLAICAKIITKHGGTIWYESEPESGSSFYFTVKKENKALSANRLKEKETAKT